MEETIATDQLNSRKFNISNISYFIIGIFSFLLPFFFFPGGIPLQMSKGMLFAGAVIIALAFYLVSVIKTVKIEVPTNVIALAGVAVPIIFLVSSIVSGFSEVDVLGYSFEVGTLSFIVLSFILLLLTSVLFQRRESVFMVFLGFGLSSLLVLVFQAVRLILAPSLSLGLLTAPTSNLIGNWNELGLFAGVALVFSLIVLEMVSLTRLLKILFHILSVLSIGMLIVVNFNLAWALTAIFAGVFFIYLVSFEKFRRGVAPLTVNSQDGAEITSSETNRKISFQTLAVVVISLFFLLFGGSISGYLTGKLNIADIEVRPSWSSTLSVTKQALSEYPVLGVGPGHFGEVWLQNKPLEVNQTPFWNIDFAYGIGLIPTFLATTGLLGLASWLFFLLAFLYIGVRSIFKADSDEFSRFLILASFLVASYLWAVALLYVPSVTLFVLAFFFTGLFAATLMREGIIGKRTFSLHHPKVSFISVLFLVVILIATISLGYVITQKTLSYAHFDNAIQMVADGESIDGAQAELEKAASWGGYDIYYRSLAELHVLRLRNLLSATEVPDPEALLTQAQSILAASINSARTATEISPENYQNWLTLGRIYADLVPPPFSVPGAYESAKESYEEALAHNPHNPAIYLLLARLEMANEDFVAAREYANKSLEKKENYADAHFLVAQLEVNEGNLQEAIPALERTLILSPNNPGLFFQLGVMKYSNGDYAGARDAFAQALVIVPEYANAKYFLALSLYNLGNSEDALTLFEEVAEGNPDNSEVALIIENLKAGREPFAGAEPPIDESPEDRDELPLQDEE